MKRRTTHYNTLADISFTFISADTHCFSVLFLMSLSFFHLLSHTLVVLLAGTCWVFPSSNSSAPTLAHRLSDAQQLFHFLVVTSFLARILY